MLQIGLLYSRGNLEHDDEKKETIIHNDFTVVFVWMFNCNRKSKTNFICELECTDFF